MTGGRSDFQPPTCTRQTPPLTLIPASGERKSSGVGPTSNLRLARVKRQPLTLIPRKRGEEIPVVHFRLPTS